MSQLRHAMAHIEISLTDALSSESFPIVVGNDASMAWLGASSWLCALAAGAVESGYIAAVLGIDDVAVAAAGRWG